MSLGEHELQATARALKERGVDVVRVAYADLIGTERSRDVLVRRLASTFDHGVAFCRTVYGTSPMGDVVEIEHDGLAAAEGPRQVLRAIADQFAELGLRPVVGPELEFFLLNQDQASPSGWRRYGEATGNVYVSGRKGDPEGVLLR